MLRVALVAWFARGGRIPDKRCARPGLLLHQAIIACTSLYGVNRKMRISRGFCFCDWTRGQSSSHDLHDRKPPEGSSDHIRRDSLATKAMTNPNDYRISVGTFVAGARWENLRA